MPKRSFLEVDDSLIGKNLGLVDQGAAEFVTPFNLPEEQCPSKLVQPTAGFCCKAREVGSESKVFINVCKTDAIPAPKDVTESELLSIIDTDEITDFRVPMSIGDVKTDKDKRDESVKVVDVAINTNFFTKVENSQLFKNFVMSIIFEGVANKHEIYAADERVILKNRKCFGALQMHRIRQQEINDKMGNDGKGLISEITRDNKMKPGIQVLEGEDAYVTPEYRLYKRNNDENIVYAEVKLPKITSSKELTLDINNDRFIIEAKYKKYLLDVFLPVFIREDEVICVFNTDTKILTIKMPIQKS